ncbi:MAG: DUF1559 domain-containing protein [Planctomycetaceae bacterium]|nr:DUF1559 domain-containing protein [Planctomycetaceae bacterium]
MSRSAMPRGFTLLELLVVVAIVGVLVGLLLPAVQAAREAGRRAACHNQLRQIGFALHAYHDSHGVFPTGCAELETQRIAWSLLILPRLEQQPVFASFDQRFSYRNKVNRQAAESVIPTYLCPSTVRLQFDRLGDRVNDRNGNGIADPGDFLAVTDYGGIAGSAMSGVSELLNGVLIYDRAIAARDIRDGLSQTILVAEDTGRGRSMDGEWSNGENIFDQSGPINVLQNNEMWSDHPGGVNALYCDGSAHFLTEGMSNSVLSALCSRALSDVATDSVLP